MTKNESLTEIILKVKKPDAPVDLAGQGNESKEQVSESSMIDQLSLLRPYLLCSILDWCRANKANWQNVFIDKERTKTQRRTI